MVRIQGEARIMAQVVRIHLQKKKNAVLPVRRSLIPC